MREDLALYPAVEWIDPDPHFDQVRAAPPLPSMPLVVLSAGPALGSSNPAIDQGRQATERYATRFSVTSLMPRRKGAGPACDACAHAKHVTNTHSGHAIHKEQPQLVVDTIREVVDACVTRPHGVGARR